MEVFQVPTASLSPGIAIASVSLTETGLEFGDSITYDEWLSLGQSLRRLEKSVMWWIGDWIRFGEKRWGEKYTEAITVTGYSPSTLRDAAWVSSTYDLSDRSDKLPWTHYRMATALPQNERAEVLSVAHAEGWGVREVRAEVNRRKNRIGSAPSLDTCTVQDLDALIGRGAKFGTIYADPPWVYGNQGTRAATSNHYQGMS
jgi:hypothetical protein